MTLVDISPIFSARQREALSPFGDRATVIQADVFEYLARSDQFDLIISNENMADFPALVDIPRGLLIDYMGRPASFQKNNTQQKAYLKEARDFLLALGIDPADAPDAINLNTGAVRFVRMAMEKSDRLFMVEHSSDWSLPGTMADLLRDSRTDFWPKKVILFSHNEVTIRFEHLTRLLANEGIGWEGGRLMDLLGVRSDAEIRYILLSGSIQTQSHEIIGEFIDHVKEYQWLLAHR